MIYSFNLFLLFEEIMVHKRIVFDQSIRSLWLLIVLADKIFFNILLVFTKKVIKSLRKLKKVFQNFLTTFKFDINNNEKAKS